jgi:RHS repeat-associated protein
MQGAGGVGGLLSVTSGSTSFYPTYDGNGNVSEYLDAAGAIAAHYEYDAFGNVIFSSGASAASFQHRFSTKPQDAESGLYYYGYRYFDPVTGRWPSRDPIGEEGGMNLYGFVGNNGVKSRDFLGLAEPLRPIPDFEYDPNAPIPTGPSNSPSDNSVNSGKDCFCCCVDDLTMKGDPVRPGDEDNPHNAFGHIIKVDFKTSWNKTTKDKEGVCSLMWREKTSRPPTFLFEKGARANKWYDATQLLPGNSLFKPFHDNNEAMGPGGTMLDPATVKQNGFSRTLEFEITITSTPNCGCPIPSKTVTGLQKLNPGKNEMEFTSPIRK